MSNRSREEILHRVKKGLSTVKDPSPVRTDDRNFSTESGEIQKRLAKDRKSLTEQLITEIESVNTTVFRSKKPENILNVLLELIEANDLQIFAIWETKYLKELGLKNSLKEKGLKLVTAKSKTRLATADIGITEADYAIADTGTLVLLTDNEKPRGVSLLPPIHLAIVNPENIVSNINELFIILKERIGSTKDIKSCMTFITGPSRTADIELNLTLGVHGPKELYVIIQDT